MEKTQQEDPLRESLRILKKIDRLQQALDDFQNKEQPLFNEWYAQTFETQRLKIESAYQKHRELAEVQTSISIISEMKNISEFEAFKYLKSEEELYAKGSPDECRKIDDFRNQRRAYEIERTKKDSSDSTANEDGEFAFRNLDEGALRELVNGQFGSACLTQTLGLVGKKTDRDLFFKLWALATEETKLRFESDFLLNMRQTLAEFLRGLKEAEAGKLLESAECVQLSSQEMEDIKALYRRLVRQLHPDVQDPAKDRSAWIEKTWHEVQAAYQAKDKTLLEKLLNVVLVRTKSFESLEGADVQKTLESLSEDLRELEQITYRMRKSPAWKFSSKKNLEKITFKLSAELEDAISFVDEDIQQLASQIEDFENQMAGIAVQKMKRPASRRGSLQKRKKNLDQLTFF